MSELVEFYRARLVDEERVANSVSFDDSPPHLWVYDDDHRHDTLAVTSGHVLREIKTKRLVLLRFDEVCAELAEDYAEGRKNPELSRVRSELLLVIAHHAEAYDWHEEYEEAWRV